MLFSSCPVAYRVATSEPLFRRFLRTVLEEPFLVALPEEHKLCARSSIRLTDLAQEPFVTSPRDLGAGFYDRIFGACRDAGFSPRIVQEAVQMQTIVGMVAAGIGVALVPASLQNFTRRGVVYREIEGGAPLVPLAVVWERGEEQLSTVLSSFLAVVDGLRA